MSGGGFGYGEVYYGDSPRRSGCPRCGALPEEACDPIRVHAHSTILGYHPERGMRPGELEKAGYIPYVLREDGTDFRKFLWRRPRQQAVARPGFTEEEASERDS